MAKHSFSVDNFDLRGEYDEIYVGRLFNNKEEFKIGMAIYAIKRVFRFKISRFAKDYTVMQCIDRRCDWRVFLNSENDSSWCWFLEKLKEIVDDGNDLVFVTDRQPSISTAIELHFPMSHHGVCLVHLGRNISSIFKDKFLADMVTRAGEVFQISAFKVLYEKIKIKDEECWKYLEKIGVTHWTRAYSSGLRYNLMSSNVAEFINNALTPARDFPIVSLLEFIRRMLSRWFNTRRKKSASLIGEIPPEVDKLLIENLEASAGLSVLPTFDWHFEVLGRHGGQYHVDLQNMSCTCQAFDKLKIPCCHAIAAGGKRGLKNSLFVDELYKKNIWTATY